MCIYARNAGSCLDLCLKSLLRVAGAHNVFFYATRDNFYSSLKINILRQKKKN